MHNNVWKKDEPIRTEIKKKKENQIFKLKQKNETEIRIIKPYSKSKIDKRIRRRRIDEREYLIRVESDTIHNNHVHVPGRN